MANKKLSNSPELTPTQRMFFAEKVEIFRQGVQKMQIEYFETSKFTHQPPDRVMVEDGGRYTRVYKVDQIWIDTGDHSKGGQDQYFDTRLRKSIHSFLDKNTGDVLKPASAKAPASTARGNLFDAHNGLSMVNHFGPNYLR